MQWEFFQGEDGRWRWRCYTEDGRYTESQLSFAGRTDCIADAMRYGFLVGEPGCDPADNIRLLDGAD